MTPWNKRADMVVHQEDPFNAEPTRAALARDDVTAVDSFYVRNHGPVPKIDASQWRLHVGGLVARELDLSLRDLRSGFEVHELVATLQCAGNRRVGFLAVREIPGEAPWGPGATGTATWTGVRLCDVLGRAGLDEGARHVELVGADVSQEARPSQPFGGSIPRHKALAGEVLLAWEMNGQALPAVHGAPVRAIVPGYIGARSVKWLQRVSALGEPSANYFQASTYRLLPPHADPQHTRPGEGVALGAVAINGDILVPDEGSRLPAGRTRVAGYALAGDDRTVVRVDVSADGGATWEQATLRDQRGPWAWRRWEHELDLPPTATEIVARAWDSSAASQPEDPAHLWNPKGYVNNAWARTTVEVMSRSANPRSASPAAATARRRPRRRG